MTYLQCSARGCGTTLDLHDRALACPRCGDLLEVFVDVPDADPQVWRRLWRQRRLTWNARDTSGVWRFAEVLPPYEGDVVTLGEGNIPLVPGQATTSWAGLKSLAFKHLGFNPTGSFKDLGMTVGMTEARFLGARTVGCASTGNTAAALAAYAARGGMQARVYLPAGQASNNKLAQALDYGAEVVQIEGSFDDALNELLSTAGGELYFLNSINPFRIEGQKTAMYELAEQCDWDLPEVLVVPGGNLGNSSAFGKAFIEMKRFGLVDRVPRLAIVQAEGANPLARMWRAGLDTLHALPEPETVATAIRIGNPRSWRKALEGVAFTNGTVLDVSDEELGEAKDRIGRDGIGCEPASATTLAGLRKLAEQGWLHPEERVVAVLTGHVLKDTEYIIKRRHQARTQTPA